MDEQPDLSFTLGDGDVIQVRLLSDVIICVVGFLMCLQIEMTILLVSVI